MKREDTYYLALLTRDNRFDGKFFVGVKTTGVYCRPICPAKPKRENVIFFANHLEAERAGFRPCLRCRPESAPRSPAWIGKSAIVRRAIKVLHSQETINFDENKFAALFGVTARHLRRLFVEEIGKTPKQLSFENRLNLSRKLITETALPMAEIAYAAGFDSIRRFNFSFKNRFKKTPSDVRRKKVGSNGAMKISLPYRPPFDFQGLLASYKNHRIGNLESFEDTKMHREIFMNGQCGRVSISDNPSKSSLDVEIDFPDSSVVHAIISRVRALFDLDSDPAIIANSLETDSAIKALLKKHRGIRLPSGWDGFEVAISAILGQLVSVERGRALVHDLIVIAGRDSKYFPTPKEIITADLTSLKTTRQRKLTLVEFSKALIENKISLEPTQDVDNFTKNALAIKGIGPWTANYMSLKILRHADAFPKTDLILARALNHYSLKNIEKMRPWRGYVAALLWKEHARKLKEVNL